MENSLEQMQNALDEKERQFDKDEDLKFSENYNEIMKSIEKQKKILEKCTKFYKLLRQKDETNDPMQEETTKKQSHRKNTIENEEAMCIDMQNMDKPLQNDMYQPRIERRPLTEEEEKILERWDQYSKEMDEILMEVAKELEITLNKLEHIETEQDKNMEMADLIGKDVDNLRKDVEMSNMYLKQIVSNLRSPGKICADLSLALILSMLIGVLVYVIRLYISLE
jgi:chromosome segregation ATPase